MLQNLPFYLTTGFIITTFLAAAMVPLLINTASKPINPRNTVSILISIMTWLAAQAVLSLNGIYTRYPAAIPPRVLLLGVLPTIIIIILIFITRKGKSFIDRLSMQMLTYVHLIRIPVELVLYGLFISGAVPELMTFQDVTWIFWLE